MLSMTVEQQIEEQRTYILRTIQDCGTIDAITLRLGSGNLSAYRTALARLKDDGCIGARVVGGRTMFVSLVGHASHFCGYPCMARKARSDTQVEEDHHFDGTCITCGAEITTGG